MAGFASTSTNLKTFTSGTTHFKQYVIDLQNLPSLNTRFITCLASILVACGLVVRSSEAKIDLRAFFCFLIQFNVKVATCVTNSLANYLLLECFLYKLITHVCL